MRLRCRICKAWKIGDRIVRRTPRTDTCFLCEPVHGRARRRAQVEARLDAEKALVRQWLLRAPRFDERLLIEARAAHPRRERAMVPWADTLDLDDIRYPDHPSHEGAVGWLYWRTDGQTGDWPPANDDAGFRLINSLNLPPWVGSPTFEETALDIGSAFGQRGFPYPPNPVRHGFESNDEGGIVLDRHLVHVHAWLRSLHEATLARREPPGQPLGASVLPDHYTDVLALSLRIHLFRTIDRDPDAWEAVGSIFRDDSDRIIVLWR